MAAPEHGPQLDSSPQQKCTNALGAVKLVSADAERGHAEIVKPHRHLACRLSRIAMKGSACCQCHEVTYRLDRSCLMIGEHDGQQPRLGSSLPGDDVAARIDWQPVEREA